MPLIMSPNLFTHALDESHGLRSESLPNFELSDLRNKVLIPRLKILKRLPTSGKLCIEITHLGDTKYAKLLV